jgi:glycerol-3-phosphate acyltransferase PlsX
VKASGPEVGASGQGVRTAGARIAVDAMGGDEGPGVVADGVVRWARASSAHFLLVGNAELLSARLAQADQRLPNVEVIPAAEVIEMTDQPTTALKRKPDASIVVAARLVKEGRADGLVSIGNTGAAMAVSLLTLGRIKGIDRPAIAIPMPSLVGPCILLDAGATVDCDPNNLYEFAIMGSVYSQLITGSARPRVGLVSIGEEDSKGNELVKRTNALFRQATQEGIAPFQFIGNVEGRHVFRGDVDVAVCDGFVGNVMLKTGEGVAELVLRLVKDELGRHGWLKPLLLPFRPALQRLRSRLDYSAFGGAPLLGVNGICIIGHGRSNADAVSNACAAAERAVEHSIVDSIRQQIHRVPLPPLA